MGQYWPIDASGTRATTKRRAEKRAVAHAFPIPLRPFDAVKFQAKPSAQLDQTHRPKEAQR